MEIFLRKGIDFAFALCYHAANGLKRTRTQRLFVYVIFCFFRPDVFPAEEEEWI